jgi:hypothetical protein
VRWRTMRKRRRARGWRCWPRSLLVASAPEAQTGHRVRSLERIPQQPAVYHPIRKLCPALPAGLSFPGTGNKRLTAVFDYLSVGNNVPPTHCTVPVPHPVRPILLREGPACLIARGGFF